MMIVEEQKNIFLRTTLASSPTLSKSMLQENEYKTFELQNHRLEQPKKTATKVKAALMTTEIPSTTNQWWNLAEKGIMWIRFDHSSI